MLGDLFDEMATTISAAVGPGVQVTSRRNFSPDPPSIDIYPGDPFEEGPAIAGFGGPFDDVLVTVRARVSPVDHLGQQDLLLRFMDETDAYSIAGALFDDQDLGGLASSVSPEGCSGYLQFIEGDGAPLLGCEWRIRVVRVIT